MGEITSQTLDMCLITETWIKNDTYITKINASGLNSDNLRLIHADSKKTGGGIGIVYDINAIQLKLLEKSTDFTSFQYLVTEINKRSIKIKLLLLYHPPGGSTGGITDVVYLDEFMQCMENVTSLYGSLIVCGDFNLKVNDPKDINAATLVDLMSAMGYVQLVEFATHNQGNTLDLVFTPCDKEVHPKDIVCCSQGSFISDHCSILFDLNMLKIETQNATLQRISYRNLKHINNWQLSYSIRDAFANISFADMNVNEALEILETNITIALDKHAPMQSKLKKKRVLTPWFD